MADPYGYWTMFGGPDPDPTPDPDPATSAPPAPDPIYHSVITGTFDPTPAEIVAAAEASGLPVPPGMDPIEYSRMASGLPPIALSASSGSPSGMPPSSSIPALPTSGSSPSISMPPSSSFSLPSVGTSSGISGSPFTAAMKTLSYDGGGGLLCDPITGKCPQYR